METKAARVRITYFVHGTTTDNEAGIATGWNQGILSEKGRKQNAGLKKLIQEKKFDAVFCSDLKRAVDTARTVFGKAIKDRRLRECNYGDLNGAPAEKVEDVQAIENPYPAGESYRDVEKRIRDFLDDIRKKYPGKRIAIVAHRGPQLALDVILKGKSWKRAMKEDWRRRKAWKPGWEYRL